MWTADQTIGVTYNGEIYNHAELRAELQKAGRVFQTDHSDTEVLLHAYAEWGDGFVERLNGMPYSQRLPSEAWITSSIWSSSSTGRST